MANFFHLLTTILIVFNANPLFSSNEHQFLELLTCDTSYCDAPSPDSFHVLSYVNNDIVLGWVPVWADASYTVELSKYDHEDWVNIFTISNIIGNSYLLSELTSGYYRARIATHCSPNEVSFRFSEMFFEFKVIDLTTAGRIPENPTPGFACNSINYSKHEWIGFKVTETSTGLSGVFEVVAKPYPYYTHAEVKSVYESSIVATDDNGDFPGSPLQVDSPFLIQDKSKAQPNIGEIILENNIQPDGTVIIFLCNVINNPLKPWISAYEFSTLTAEEIITDIPNDPSVNIDREMHYSNNFDDYRVQNPFCESLKVDLPIFRTDSINTCITIFNLNGQIYQKFESYLNSPSVILQTGSLPNGCYILRIQNNFETHSFKVVKSN